MKQSRFGYEVGLEFVRQLIDEGKVYTFSFRNASGSTALVYRIKTGANKASLTLYVSSSAKTTIDLIEAPTVTTAGTASKLYNLNRNFGDDDIATKLFTGAVITGGTGTTFKVNQSGYGTSPGLASSSDAAPGSGYQLKPNTDYVFVFTPSTAEVTVIGELFEIGK